MTISVYLSPDEMHLALVHGVYRRLQKLSGLRRDRIQKDRSTWDNELEGACAELAFCKYRGMYWTGLTQLKAKDGNDVEVRWTRYLGSGGLIIYAHDEDDDVFVLMDGFAPTYNIVGWARGRGAKKAEYLTKFGYLLPRENLRTINRAVLTTA